MSRARFFSIVIVLIVSGLSFWWLYTHMDWPLLKKSWDEMDRAQLLLSIAGVALATLCGNAIQGVRLFVLFPSQVSLRRHIGLIFMMHTGNTLIPMKAGELIRPFFIKRWDPNVKLKSIVAWIIVDRILEVAGMIPFAALGVYFLYKQGVAEMTTHVWIGLMVLLVLVILALAALKPPRWRRILAAFFLSIAMWGFFLLGFYAVLPTFEFSLSVLTGVSVAAALPALPGGIGTFQAAFVFVATKFGMSGAEALLIAVIQHATQIISTLAVGLVLVVLWGWPKKQELMVFQEDVHKQR